MEIHKIGEDPRDNKIISKTVIFNSDIEEMTYHIKALQDYIFVMKDTIIHNEQIIKLSKGLNKVKENLNKLHCSEVIEKGRL